MLLDKSSVLELRHGGKVSDGTPHVPTAVAVRQSSAAGTRGRNWKIINAIGGYDNGKRTICVYWYIYTTN